MGRFINKDPIEESGGLNLYGFCRNNSINGYDYLGMLTDDQQAAEAARLNALYNHSWTQDPAAMYGGDMMNRSTSWMGGPITNWRDEPPPPPPQKDDPNGSNSSGGSGGGQSKTYTGPDGNTYVVTNNPGSVPTNATILAWGTNYGLDAGGNLVSGGSNAGLIGVHNGSLGIVATNGFAGLASAGDGRYSDGSIPWVTNGGEAKADGKAGPFNAPAGMLIYHGTPPGSQVFRLPNGQPFLAPAGTDFNAIYTAGVANGTSKIAMNNAEGHWGTFDFQRNGGQGNLGDSRNVFYTQYTNASNYGVGVYLNGAGYSLVDALDTASMFARLFSSNAGSPAQGWWQTRGWYAAQGGTPNGK